MHLDAYFCLVCMKILIFLYTYDTVTSLFWGRDMRSTSAHLRTVRVLESHIEEMSQPQGNPYSAWVRRFVLYLRVGTVVHLYRVLFESLNFFGRIVWLFFLLDLLFIHL
jgi:hypothetical protein